jgi:hypothetical protein
MTRIVRTAYRYKRPAGKRKPVALKVPAVIAAKNSRRPVREQAAAEMILQPPYPGGKGAAHPSTPRAAERVAHPANADHKSAIVTARRPRAVNLLSGLLAETPEEHRQRGDAADALWRELVRRIAAKK